MFNETITEEFIVQNFGSSEGTQVKYYKNGYWYKEDHIGHEGRAEYLASRLLQFSDLPKAAYVLYEQGQINGKSGCRSRNFLKEGEELVTFYRLYYNEFGENLAQVLARMEDVGQRIRYTIRFIKECCSVDVTEYLARVVTFDRIVLNEDRHVNNLALVTDGNTFRAAPIFDNGVSLLTANRSVNRNFPLAENVKRVVAKPFSGSFDQMYAFFGNAVSFRKEEALAWLWTEPDSMERDVLLYQFERLAVEEHGEHGTVFKGIGL